MKLNWGYSIILFFVVFCSLMIAFMVFSFRQNNDLVTEDYYEKGADYTSQMEVNSRSVTYNDSIHLTDRTSHVVARFAKSIKEMADTINIYVYRPSDKRLDYTINALLHTDSLMIDKKQMAKGRYTITFNWFHEKKRYQVEKEFFME